MPDPLRATASIANPWISIAPPQDDKTQGVTITITITVVITLRYGLGPEITSNATAMVLAPPTTQLTVRCAVEGPGGAGEDAVLGGLPPRPPDGPLCDYRGRVMGGHGATYL